MQIVKLKLTVESKYYHARDVELVGELPEVIEDINRWIDDTTAEVIIKNDPDPRCDRDGVKFFKLFDCTCAKDVPIFKDWRKHVH